MGGWEGCEAKRRKHQTVEKRGKKWGGGEVNTSAEIPKRTRDQCKSPRLDGGTKPRLSSGRTFECRPECRGARPGLPGASPLLSAGPLLLPVYFCSS